jgi:hypothetical protein
MFIFGIGLIGFLYIYEGVFGARILESLELMTTWSQVLMWFSLVAVFINAAGSAYLTKKDNRDFDWIGPMSSLSSFIVFFFAVDILRLMQDAVNVNATNFAELDPSGNIMVMGFLVALMSATNGIKGHMSYLVLNRKKIS